MYHINVTVDQEVYRTGHEILSPGLTWGIEGAGSGLMDLAPSLCSDETCCGLHILFLGDGPQREPTRAIKAGILITPVTG